MIKPLTLSTFGNPVQPLFIRQQKHSLPSMEMKHPATPGQRSTIPDNPPLTTLPSLRHQLPRRDVVPMRLKVLDQAAQEGVSCHRLAVTHQRTVAPSTRHRHVHAPGGGETQGCSAGVEAQGVFVGDKNGDQGAGEISPSFPCLVCPSTSGPPRPVHQAILSPSPVTSSPSSPHLSCSPSPPVAEEADLPLVV